MPLIARLVPEDSAAQPSDWAALVRPVQEWAARQDVQLRDAVVLVPLAQHLPVARRAWAQRGGWMPRIETSRTLARALRPAPIARAGHISLDAANDRLTATQFLAKQSWARAWVKRDAQAFAQTVAHLVEAAHALWRASANVPPKDRAAYWQHCRSVLSSHSGPGSLEHRLAVEALEWVVGTDAPVTDTLFELRPSAWIAVQAGGADVLTRSLFQTACEDIPCAVLDTDVAPAAPFEELATCGHNIQVAACAGLEDEAQCAAAQVLTHLACGQHPVALIAQDRLLVRRVRALLERQQVVLQDETGWKLSTTRAAAQVMSLLRAAQPQATTDTVLDWLKAGAASERAPLALLEAQLRHKGWGRVASVDPAWLEGIAADTWHTARSMLRDFTSPLRKTLADWLAKLGVVLHNSGNWAQLQLDDAGKQVLDALGLAQAPSKGSAWDANRARSMMTLDEFSACVDGTLEQATYLPTPANPDTVNAQVIITPLARAVLRPFAAIVFPGVDEKHLGAPAQAPALFGESLSVALGLPSKLALRDAQTLAFAQVLRAPKLTILWRRVDGADPLAASPLLERLTLTARSAKVTLADWVDPRTKLEITSQSVPRPAPQAPALLPTHLSASAYEALRACPYRFFALHMLRLSDDEELEDRLDKRDFGSWLHRTLYEFHRARLAPTSAEQELTALRACAAAQQVAMGLDDADFLPFSASFARFAPRYIEWLHKRDAAGAQWLDGEHKISIHPTEISDVELYGRLDRIDSVPPDTTQLIDYKTSSAQKLQDQVKQAQEDTQLAFYAALMARRTSGELHAIYLALDDNQSIKEVPHKQVADSARQLLAGLADEYARLREGAGLPALGERSACEHCEARGLCRRDHWAAS